VQVKLRLNVKKVEFGHVSGGLPVQFLKLLAHFLVSSKNWKPCNVILETTA